MIQHLGTLIDCFVLSFKNNDDDPTRRSFDKYYIPLLEMKDFNVFIDNKPFFDHSVKNKQEAYEKLFEMNKNIFSKGYTENWLREIFIINSILKAIPWTYKLKHLSVEKVIGSFYEKELLLTIL